MRLSISTRLASPSAAIQHSSLRSARRFPGVPSRAAFASRAQPRNMRLEWAVPLIRLTLSHQSNNGCINSDALCTIPSQCCRDRALLEGYVGRPYSDGNRAINR